MLHGISYKAVNNQPLQDAIANGASKDYISSLKQRVAYEATIDYDYTEVTFSELAAILSNDFAFNPFKFKTVAEGAVYNEEVFPNPTGRIRGRSNTNNRCTWVCLDIDDTTISDSEFHTILGNINHHIARTSDKANPYKYRVILPLSVQVELDNDHWKPFINSIAKYIQCKVDRLPKSQLFIGYSDRIVLTMDKGTDLDPTPHLEMARTKVTELEEKRALAIPKTQATVALQSPYSTFSFAYEAASGEGTTQLLGAINKAKSLGADRDYIKNLVVSINNFWDKPMPHNRLMATVMTAI